MKTRAMNARRLSLLLVIPIAVAALFALVACNSNIQARGEAAPKKNDKPKTSSPVVFNEKGELERPTGYRKWTFVGAPLTPHDMNGGKAAFPEFHTVYINPKAFNQYEKTGEFPDGTVLVKELINVGKGGLVSEHVGPLVEADRKNVSFRFDRATAYYFLALALYDKGEYSRAENSYRTAIEDFSFLSDTERDSMRELANYTYWLGRAYSGLAASMDEMQTVSPAVTTRDAGKIADTYSQALKFCMESVALFPRNPRYQELRAIVLTNLGELYSSNLEHEKSRQVFEEAVEYDANLVGQNENVPQYRYGLVLSRTSLGKFWLDAASTDPEKGDDYLSRARRECQAAVRDGQTLVDDAGDDVPRFRLAVAKAFHVLALVESALGEFETALGSETKAEEVLRPAFASGTTEPDYRTTMHEILNRRCNLLLEIGDFNSFLDAFERFDVLRPNEPEALAEHKYYATMFFAAAAHLSSGKDPKRFDQFAAKSIELLADLKLADLNVLGLESLNDIAAIELFNSIKAHADHGQRLKTLLGSGEQ